MLRKTTFHTALLTSACLFTSAAFAASFNIPGGDLKSALDAYAHQSGITLMYSPDAVKGAQSRGATGNLTNNDALSKILSGTGLSQYRTESGEIGIIRGRSSKNEIQPLQLAQAAPAGRIEEVLVTARRREEAVENIPISITALSSEDLKTFGVRNFADLEGVVPGLSMGGGGNGVKKDSNPFIRGIGQRETKVTLDPGVATYIDGIYIGRAAGAMLDVTDVESVQVFRGPQGTLFGRNATGGALSVNLKKPTNNWEAQVSANIGNYGRRDLMGIINVPIMEDFLMARLMVASTNSNGYFTNVVDNTKWGGDNRVSGIAQLRFVPTDNLTFDILGERTRIRETPRPQRCKFIRETGFSTFQSNIVGQELFGSPNFEQLCKASESYSNSQFGSDMAIGDRLFPQGRYWVDTSTIGVTATWDVGDVGPISGLTVKNIAAWRKTLQIADEDLDGIPASSLIRVQPTFDRTTQLSDELQISGHALNDRLFFSTGFYFFKEKTPQNDLYLTAGVSPSYPLEELFGIPGYLTSIVEPAYERLQTNNHAYAWYGQADFDITPEIQASAGIRWTREKRWSRYSKAYVQAESAIGPFTPFLNGNGIEGGITDNPNPVRPILEWKFGSRTYSKIIEDYGNPNGQINEVLVTTFVPGLMIGDELSYTNSAWTPSFSLKYNAGERFLQSTSLDQAMFYATYSQGFHSGGVTAGALDTDAPNRFTFNNFQNTGVPCPNNTQYCNFLTLAEPGYGTADPQIFEPEKVTNYEVGFKLSGLDRRLQVNLSAFYMNYTNMQTTATISRLGIPIPYIENVGKSVIKGIEFEITALPTPQWRLLMNGGYTDADIKVWDSAQTPLDAAGGQPIGIFYTLDRSDERMPRVPRWQLFGSSEYSFNLGSGGTLTPSVGVRFTSSIYHGFDRGSWIYSYGGYYYKRGGDAPPSISPTNFQCTGAVPSPRCDWHGADSNPQADPLITPSPDAKWNTTSRPTAFLDARIGWISEDGKMEAALWGKNLFNKDDYLVGGIPLADVTGAVGQVFANPRTFGLTFTYHFGE